MKKLISFVCITALLFTSCTGDQGPMGPPGLDGADGGAVTSKAFEIEVDFNAVNEYSFAENYGFELEPSDVTLVYILWEVDSGTDVWRLMPQTVNFDAGQLIYNYDFTRTDVRFFLEGTVDLGSLESDWTQGQVFRVVVVPADNIDGVDVNNLEAVMQANNIYSFDLKY